MMFNFGFLSKRRRLPRTNLLAYILPPFTLIPRPGVAIEDLWAAVGHISGIASYWYDAEDEPITRLAVGIPGDATEGEGISELTDINTANILFKLVNADQQTGRLAVYAADTDLDTLIKAYQVLKIPVPTVYLVDGDGNILTSGADALITGV